MISSPGGTGGARSTTHAAARGRRGVFDNRRGDGKFYLYYTDNSGKPDEPLKQIGVAVADGPLGPFEDKGRLVSGAIDVHLFQDDDGRLNLYYSDMVGGATLRVQPMADPLTKQGDSKVLVGPTESWEQIGGAITEAPFMIKRRGIYYLMYSGASAQSPDYAIGYATATSPLGPFEKYAGNPIVRRGGAVLGPGHHCIIVDPDGRRVSPEVERGDEFQAIPRHRPHVVRQSGRHTFAAVS
jgi:xylan 1,4-beta-xylosidase